MYGWELPMVYEIFFPVRGDDRGSLIALECLKEVPFDIKRVYYIFDTKTGVSRGFHAHINLKQLLVCVKGNCKVKVESKTGVQWFLLESPLKGLLIDGLVWREMHEFSEDCVLMVLASDHYDESDYIRDYKQFLNMVKINA